MNDTLLKVIIDWMFGWVGSNRPSASRLGRSSSRGLNMLTPRPPDMIASHLAKSFPHCNHKSQLMRHKVFSFHSAHSHHPAAHKQRGAQLLQQHGNKNRKLHGLLWCSPSDFDCYSQCLSRNLRQQSFDSHINCICPTFQINKLTLYKEVIFHRERLQSSKHQYVHILGTSNYKMEKLTKSMSSHKAGKCKALMNQYRYMI